MVLVCGFFDPRRRDLDRAERRGEGQAAQDKNEIVILAFGDSLSAGYHIPPDKAFPAQLQAALREKGYPVRVLNSGVSGDTAGDGLARLEWSLDEKVDGAIVEFGANDALRGIDPKVTEQALAGILKALKRNTSSFCLPAWRRRAIGGRITAMRSARCIPGLRKERLRSFIRSS